MNDVQPYRRQIDCLEGKLVNGLVRNLGSWPGATSCSEGCSCELGGWHLSPSQCLLEQLTNCHFEWLISCLGRL